jgi:hypothetical protein
MSITPTRIGFAIGTGQARDEGSGRAYSFITGSPKLRRPWLMGLFYATKLAAREF